MGGPLGLVFFRDSCNLHPPRRIEESTSKHFTRPRRFGMEQTILRSYRYFRDHASSTPHPGGALGAFCPTRASVRHSILKPVAVPYCARLGSCLANDARGTATSRSTAATITGSAAIAWAPAPRRPAPLRASRAPRAPTAGLRKVQNWARIECLKTPLQNHSTAPHRVFPQELRPLDRRPAA